MACTTEGQDVVMTVEGRTYGGLSSRQRSQERRERLLDAARELIADAHETKIPVNELVDKAQEHFFSVGEHRARRDSSGLAGRHGYTTSPVTSISASSIRFEISTSCSRVSSGTWPI